MWKRSDVDNGKKYVIALIQKGNGGRSYLLAEPNDIAALSGALFVTEVVPNDLLEKGNLKRISELVKLIGGKRFYVDAHNIWFTEEEANAFLSDEEDNKIPWVNGLAPNFAPK